MSIAPVLIVLSGCMHRLESDTRVCGVTHMSMCVCVWQPEVSFSVYPQAASIECFEIGSLIGLRFTDLFWMV